MRRRRSRKDNEHIATTLDLVSLQTCATPHTHVLGYKNSLPQANFAQPVSGGARPTQQPDDHPKADNLDTIEPRRVRLTSRCPISYSLEARKAPADSRSGWARPEFAADQYTRSAQLFNTNERLLSSYASDCIHCILICKALCAFRPGWEPEKSRTEIFLSPDLPVVVRWIRGGSPSWRSQHGCLLWECCRDSNFRQRSS